jgi:mRNA interferase HigB
MKIISASKLTKFALRHREASGKLSSWARTLELTSAKNFSELKLTFRRADYVPREFTVFDVGGNAYRVVTVVDYVAQRVLVVGVFTHAEYDRWTKDNRGK